MKLFRLLFLLGLASPVLAQHTAVLNWTASTDAKANPSLTYNVYRASGACPTSGTSGFTKLNTSGIAAATFTDSTVTLGSFCYYATAVVNGAESLPSNLTPTVVLPKPPSVLTITAN